MPNLQQLSYTYKEKTGTWASINSLNGLLPFFFSQEKRLGKKRSPESSSSKRNPKKEENSLTRAYSEAMLTLICLENTNNVKHT